MPSNSPVGDVFSNTSVSTFQPHPLVVGVGKVGIELELEGLEGRPSNINHWDVMGDGSLRNYGREFVTRGSGLGGSTLFDAISSLTSYLKDTKFSNSFRCSTHFHINLSDLTETQLKRFLLIYAYYEKFLFSEIGEDRFKSNFCRPLNISSYLTDLVSNFLREDHSRDDLINLSHRWGKYSALNLRTLCTYGTGEFRMSYATTSFNRMLKSCNLLLSLREAAIDLEPTGRELIQLLHSEGLDLVFTKCLDRGSVMYDDQRLDGYSLSNFLNNKKSLESA